MLAPIVIFTYARPDHTQKTIEALARNSLAKDSEVFIFSDSYKRPSNKDAVEAVRKYIDKVEDKGWFSKVHVIKAEKNKGLATSVIEGVTEVINRYDKVIVVEDDLITSTDFLQYMNDALNFYEKNSSVWSISGYSFPIIYPKDYNCDIFACYRGCSWGWATWKDRWNSVDWSVSDYKNFKYNLLKRLKLNRGGRDMSKMLDFQMKGKIDSWAIRWCYAQAMQDKYTIYPVVSRIKNIGIDGSGTHGALTHRFDTNISDGKIRCVFEEVKFNRYVVKQFRNRYSPCIAKKVFLRLKKVLSI